MLTFFLFFLLCTLSLINLVLTDIVQQMYYLLDGVKIKYKYKIQMQLSTRTKNLASQFRAAYSKRGK